MGALVFHLRRKEELANKCECIQQICTQEPTLPIENGHILCFTRRPLTSLPSNTSLVFRLVITVCSPALATYAKSSVKTEGQLVFKYSNPSVCITAAATSFHTCVINAHLKRKILLILNNMLLNLRMLCMWGDPAI